jgi:hypothetical protein
VRHELDAVPVGVREMKLVFADFVHDAGTVEVRRGVVQRLAGSELERLVIEAGAVARLDELERVRLVGAAEERAVVLASALGQAELDGPAGHRLVKRGHAQSDVVDSAKA